MDCNEGKCEAFPDDSFHDRSLPPSSPPSSTVTNVTCSGNETVLAQCEWEEGSCDSEQLAGVVCLDQSKDSYGKLFVSL